MKRAGVVMMGCSTNRAVKVSLTEKVIFDKDERGGRASK